MGRVRISIIPDCSAKNLTPFIENNIEHGSTIITDKWTGYTKELKENYTHKSFKSCENYSSLEHVHRIASLVKRWVTGTFHASIKPEHLQEYMDEYIFRFNRRNTGSIGFKFYRLMKFSSFTKPVTYKSIIEKLEQT